VIYPVVETVKGKHERIFTPRRVEWEQKAEAASICLFPQQIEGQSLHFKDTL